MLFVLFLLLVSVKTIHGGTHDDFKRLHGILTSNYNKDLRPTLNSSEPTKVNVGFYLLSLKEFEEKTSKFSIVGAFNLIWYDFQLEWNPDDFGGIQYMFFPQSTFWKPDLLLINPYEKIEPPGFNDLKILLNNDGSVYWSPPDVYEVTCQADVTYYPFDQQTCSLYFGIYMHTDLDVVLEPLSSDIFLEFYTSNSLWDLKDASCSVNADLDASFLVLTTVLRRRPMFQIVNTIVPFCILGLLNIMVFLLPAEAGERVGFSVTVLLAIAVFMTIVADTLPGTSEPSFPRLCYLLTAELCINMLVTICTIFVLKLHLTPKNETIPSWMENMKVRILCPHTITKIGTAKENAKDNDLTNQSDICIETDASKKMQEFCKHREGIEKDSKWNRDTETSGNSSVETKREQSGKTTWKTVAKFLDMVFFVFFLLLFGSTKITAYFVFA